MRLPPHLLQEILDLVVDQLTVSRYLCDRVRHHTYLQRHQLVGSDHTGVSFGSRVACLLGILTLDSSIRVSERASH